MILRTRYCLSVLVFLLICHTTAAQTPKFFAVDSLIDWADPFSVPESAIAAPFQDMGVTDQKWLYKKMKSGEDCRIFSVSSDRKCQLQFLQNRFPVHFFQAFYSHDGQLYRFTLRLNGQIREILDAEMEKHLGTRINMGKMRFDGKDSPIWRWDSPQLILISHMLGAETLLLDVVNPKFLLESPFPIRKTVMTIGPQTVAAPVDLDALLDFDKIWTYSPEDLERMYRVKTPDQKDGAQFEWTDADKTQARFSRKLNPASPTSLTLLAKGVEAEEVTLKLVNGRVARVTVTLYNRPDSGDIELTKFKGMFVKTGQHLKQVLAQAPKDASREESPGKKVVRWLWESPKGLALIEHNDYEPAAGKVPEFLRLQLAAPVQGP